MEEQSKEQLERFHMLNLDMVGNQELLVDIQSIITWMEKLMNHMLLVILSTIVMLVA